MRILGIETSCDDTCAAVVEASGGLRRPVFHVRSNVISSQTRTHAPYGGVVPSLAAREHAKNIAPVLHGALRNAGYRIQDIDLITVTAHPGLFPSLLVGVHAARTLAWLYKKPILGINHLHGHIASILLPINSKRQIVNGKKNHAVRYTLSAIRYPAIGLIVSGGHTQLVLLRELGKIKVVGETRDDAAGEAFDKIARLLGLPFPGGPAIAAEAAKFKIRNPKSETDSKFQILNSQFSLPRPMFNSKDLDFSFSGLKTATFYLVQDLKKHGQDIPTPTICAEVQQAIIDVLIAKTLRAAKRFHARSVFLSGGVSANRELRRQLVETMRREFPSVACHLPFADYTQDNAAMIAAAGYLQWQRMVTKQRKRASWQRVSVPA